MNSIVFSQKNSIGYVCLNRPHKRNALSLAALNELEEVLHDISYNNDIRIVIIKGNGKDFCSGHDLIELSNKNHTIHDYRTLFTISARIMQFIHNMPQPVIAQVHGSASAAGCQLVASCDLAIAETNATFTTPGVKIGLFCSTPMVPLSRSVGRKKALEMLFTGTPLSAAEAERIGLINRVVDSSMLETETEQLATTIGQFSPSVLSLGKQAFYQQIDQSESDAYDLSKEIIAFNCLYSEAKEGIQARIEKRTPSWMNTQ